MKIKKFGHCCFTAEPKEGVRIMTDPGAPSFSGAYDKEENISAIIITHEHSDHLHVDSLKEVIKNNPNAIIITNSAVGKILSEAGIAYQKVEEGEKLEVMGVEIGGFGNTHAEIYDTYGQVQNTGYMIGTLCYPGDSFHYPDAEVDILALPAAGPWVKIKDAIDYGKNIKPRVAFPVHDGVLSSVGSAVVARLLGHFLLEANVQFKELQIGKIEEV